MLHPNPDLDPSKMKYLNVDVAVQTDEYRVTD